MNEWIAFGGTIRAQEAAKAAARLCELRAQRLARRTGKRELAAGALAQHSLVLLFRLGFRRLAAGLPTRHADRALGSALAGLRWIRHAPAR